MGSLRVVLISSLAVVALGCTSREVGAVTSFYSAFARRSLTDAETQALSQELLDDKARLSADDFEQTLAALEEGAARLRADDASDKALFFRHAVIERLSFDDTVARTATSYRLVMEPDPVMVADPRVSRVMTRRDVIAFVNIANFSVTSTEPHHRDLTDEQVQLVADELNRSFGAQPVAEEPMPQFYSESAAFWAGARREWSVLSDHEKELTRLYPSYTFQTEMTVDLFAKVWGLTHEEAELRSLDDTIAMTWAVTVLSGEISMYIWFMGDVSQTFHDFWAAMGQW